MRLLLLSFFLSFLFDDSCRHSGSYGVGRDVVRDYAIGSDNDAVAYCHSWHHTYIIAQPNIIADSDTSF